MPGAHNPPGDGLSGDFMTMTHSKFKNKIPSLNLGQMGKTQGPAKMHQTFIHCPNIANNKPEDKKKTNNNNAFSNSFMNGVGQGVGVGMNPGPVLGSEAINDFAGESNKKI